MIILQFFRYFILEMYTYIVNLMPYWMLAVAVVTFIMKSCIASYFAPQFSLLGFFEYTVILFIVLWKPEQAMQNIQENYLDKKYGKKI